MKKINNRDARKLFHKKLYQPLRQGYDILDTVLKTHTMLLRFISKKDSPAEEFSLSQNLKNAHSFFRSMLFFLLFYVNIFYLHQSIASVLIRCLYLCSDT